MEQSSLVFGYRATEAEQGLKRLRNELQQTLALMKQVNAASTQPPPQAAARTSARADTQKEIREIRKAGDERLKVEQEVRQAHDAQVQRWRSNQAAQERASLRLQAAQEQAGLKAQAAQARYTLQQEAVKTAVQRKTTLAELRADIIARYAEAARVEQTGIRTQAAQARYSLHQEATKEAARRQALLAELKADIVQRYAEAARVEQAGLKAQAAQARYTLRAEWDREKAQRQTTLAELKADIIRRHREAGALEETAIKTRGAAMRAELRRQEAITSARQRRQESLMIQPLGMNRVIHGPPTRMDLLERQVLTEAVQSDTRARGVNTKAISTNNRAMLTSVSAMREAHSAARGLAGSLGLLWMTWGSLVPIAAGAALGSMARQTYEVGAAVEYQLAMLRALGNEPVTVAQMMPSVHGSMQTPLGAAEGLQALAQAGQNTREALATLSTTLQLATLGGMGVADAALTATAAIATFGLEATDATRVGDVFAKGASISNASVSDIAESMKTAASSAAAYGVTLEETTAQIAVLAQSGIRGSAAGTAIQNAMREMYAPTKKASEAMKAIGLDIYNADKSSRNYLDILKDLNSEYVQLNEQSRADLLASMFNQRSRRAIQIYLQDMSRLDDAFAKVSESSGFLMQANEALLDTVTGASNRMQSVLQATFVDSFEKLKPEIRSTVEALEALFGSEGFRDGVVLAGRAFAGLTSAITENAGTILTLGAAYASYRIGLTGVTVALTILEARERSKAATMATAAAATTAATAATNANTAAQAANGAAAGVMATRTARAVGMLARFTPGLNLLAVGLTLATAAYQAFSGAQARTESSSEIAANGLDRVNANLLAQNKELERNIRLQHEQRTGQSAEQRSSGSDAAIAEQSIAEAQATLELLEREHARLRVAVRDTALSGLTPSGRDTADFLRVQKEMGEARRKLAVAQEREQVRQQALDHEGRLRAEQKLGDQLIRTQSEVASALSQISYLPEDHAGQAFAAQFEEMRTELATNVAPTEAALTRYQGVITKFQQTLSKTFSMPDSGGRGGGLEARINVSNIMLEYNNLRALARNERDFRLKLLKEETDVGVRTTAEAAQERSRLSEVYYTQVEAAAAVAASRIRSIEKGSESLRELSAEKVAISLRQEAALIEQTLAQTLEQDQASLRSEALKTAAQTTTQIASLQRKAAEDQKKLNDEVARSFLPESVQVQMAARQTAEEKFTDELEKQLALFERSEKLMPGFAQTPEGQVLAQAMGQTAGARDVAGDAAAKAALERLQAQQGMLNGMRRGLVELGTDAANVGSTISNSLVTGFNAGRDAFAEFVATGKLNFRSLITDMLAQQARLYASQGFSSLFGTLLTAGLTAFAPTAGSVGINSVSPNLSTGGLSSSAIVNPTQYRFAKGGAFEASNVRAFAKGGAFTNSIANRATMAPMALFGEAGPEAIMPLTRTSDGSLGVKAVPAGMGAGGATVQVNVHNTIILREGGIDVESSATGSANLEGLVEALTGPMTNLAVQVIHKHVGQGGVIAQAIKNQRRG